MQDLQNGERFDAIVIGGSQAGLAVGYHLRRHGLRFVILDAHARIGDAWRSRWDSLRLFTRGRYDNLPGMPFPGDRHAFPTKDQVADYLDAYAWYFDLPVRTGVKVDRVQATPDGSGFVVKAGDRVLDRRAGRARDRRLPPSAGAADGRAVTSIRGSSSCTPASTGGRRSFATVPVLVVGAANSGSEIALDIARAGGRHVWLAGRDTGHLPFDLEGRLGRWLDPVIWFGANHLLTVRSPIGRKARETFLLPRASGRAGATAASWRRRAWNVSSGASTAQPAAVRCSTTAPCSTSRTWSGATGFRRDYAWIEPSITDADGWPVQERGVVAGVAGLYIVGLPFETAIASALLGGVWRDAAYVGDRVGRAGGARPNPRAGGRDADRAPSSDEAAGTASESPSRTPRRRGFTATRRNTCPRRRPCGPRTRPGCGGRSRRRRPRRTASRRSPSSRR